MKNWITKGTGNSRYLKTVSNFLTLYPTYEAFAQAFIQGTLPVDFNGLNAAGWQQQGTSLDVAHLLTDATATAIGGLSSDPSVNDALAKINTKASNAQTTANGRANVEVIVRTATNTNSYTINFSVTPKIVFLGGIGKVNQLIPPYTPFIYGMESAYVQKTSSNERITLTWGEKSLMLSSDDSTGIYIGNYRNQQYKIIAIS